MILDLDPTAAALLAEPTRAALAAAPAPGLVLVSHPPALDAATALASHLAQTEPDSEVVAVAPPGASWAVEELSTDVIDRVAHVPDTHRHLVVSHSHAARPSCTTSS